MEKNYDYLLSSFIAFTPYFALTEKLILFRPIKLYLNYNERFGF